MTTRYTIKKWWSMKEDPEGQYVSYLEHQEALDAMRYENDNLWERMAQQAREIKLIAKDRQEWIDRYAKAWAENGGLRFALRRTEVTAWCLVAALVITIVFVTAFGVLTWR